MKPRRSYFKLVHIRIFCSCLVGFVGLDLNKCWYLRIVSGVSSECLPRGSSRCLRESFGVIAPISSYVWQVSPQFNTYTYSIAYA